MSTEIKPRSVILIGDTEDDTAYWKKVITKLMPDAEVCAYNKSFNGDFTPHSLAVILTKDPAHVEEALSKRVPTICPKLPVTKNSELAERFVKLADLNKVAYVGSPLFVLTDVFSYTCAVVNSDVFGKIKNITITYADYSKTDMIWDLGLEAFALLYHILPEDSNIGGFSVHSAPNPEQREWVGIFPVIVDDDDFGIQINLSRTGAEKEAKISVVGEKASLLCNVHEREVLVREAGTGKVYTFLGTSSLSQEEQALHCVLSIQDLPPDGGSSEFAVYMCEEVETIFNIATERKHNPPSEDADGLEAV